MLHLLNIDVEPKFKAIYYQVQCNYYVEHLKLTGTSVRQKTSVGVFVVMMFTFGATSLIWMQVNNKYFVFKCFVYFTGGAVKMGNIVYVGLLAYELPNSTVL